ncbi:MAG: exo-alpha-sialidase [Chitinophagaceae bacterium]|nr:exo-alpha-sialidase [Chitinophagaceae bacterium]
MPQLLFFLLLSLQLQAHILSPVVNLSHPDQKCNEPSVVLHPNDPQRMMVATNGTHIFYTSGKDSFQHIQPESSMGIKGDPVLLYDEDGICYFVHLAKNKTKNRPAYFDQIVIQKTSDHGATWNDGVGTGINGKMHDKPWLSADRNILSPFRGSLYLTWTQFDGYESQDPGDSSRILFACSRNQAESFSEAVVISDQSGDCMDDDSTMEGATTCIGPDGSIYAAWAGFNQIYLDRSFDGGRTWGKDQIVMKVAGGWSLDQPKLYRSNGLPFLNADVEGHLSLCTVVKEKGHHVVVVADSKDQGKHWAESVNVFRDDADYIMPHAYLDATNGNYYILCYRIQDGLMDVMLAYRKKGEKHFTTVKVNEQSFALPGELLFMGDYINVCAKGNLIVCVWTEPRDGSTVVKLRKIELAGPK